MFRNTASGFGHVAIILHWAVALLVFVMLALGNVMGALASTDPLRAVLLDLHKLIGLTILALVLLRIVWRLANPVPALPVSMKSWQRICARLSHYTLYGLTVLIPMTGWALVSARVQTPILVLFDRLPVPALPVLEYFDSGAEAVVLFWGVHDILGGLLVLLILVHIAAAMRHHFVLSDDILRRMMSARPAKRGQKPDIGAADCVVTVTGGKK
ncbi:MAG TPA: cytochrome b [Afifellaceae bacterium]|nr:cytochrome b [Afifellaceae bacterium]